jgi:hypothetical protein
MTEQSKPKKVIMRLVGSATGVKTLVDGEYLVEYNPNANGGRGDLKTSADRADARRFPTAGDAMEFWRQQSKRRPYRPDGKPNRPLTAFSVEILAEDAESIL